MYKRILVLLFFMFMNNSVSFAQFDNTGTSVANFLKIGVGGRGEAMGGAFTALVDDATALYWNPSGIARIENNQTVFSKTEWFHDLELTFVGLVLPLENFGTLGFSLNALSMGEVEITTPEEPDGNGLTYSAGNIAMGISYAKRITDRFHFGITGKYIREDVANSSASAYAIDVGTQYVTDFNGLIIGMSIKNFGTKMRLRGREQLFEIDIDPEINSNPEATARLDTKDWPIPLSFNIGTSMRIYQNDNLTLIGNLEYNDPRDQNPLYIIGTELSISEMLYLRGGFQIKYFGDNYEEVQNSSSNDQFTLGGGVLVPLPASSYSLMVDYAYTDLGILQGVQRFTVSMLF